MLDLKLPTLSALHNLYAVAPSLFLLSVLLPLDLQGIRDIYFQFRHVLQAVKNNNLYLMFINTHVLHGVIILLYFFLLIELNTSFAAVNSSF